MTQFVSRLEKLQFVVIVSIPYALMYSIALSNGLLIILLFLSIILAFCLKISLSPSDIFNFAVAQMVFIVSLIGLSYSDYQTLGRSLLETRSGLLFGGLAMLLYKPTKNLRAHFLTHFVCSVIFCFVVLIVIAVYRNILGPGTEIWFNKWYYHYSDLTEPIGIDPLYLAFFIAFAIFVVYFSAEMQVPSNLTLPRLIFVKYKALILIVLSLFLVLVGSRSLIVISVVLIFFWQFSRRENHFKHSRFQVTAILVVILTLSFLSPVTFERFKGLFDGRYSFSTYTMDRLIIWSTAIEDIRKNPTKYLFGQGTGSSEVIMARLYNEQQINWDFEKKTNTHNQYLEFLFDVGLFGLLAFLSSLAFCFHKMWKERIGLSFLLILMSSLFFENFYNRQKGVVIIGLVISMYLLSKPKDN